MKLIDWSIVTSFICLFRLVPPVTKVIVDRLTSDGSCAAGID